MGKLYILDETGEEKTPFLRGILTRSLQEAGLPFEQAYELSSSIRDDLSSKGDAQISLEDLRHYVLKEISAHYGEETAQQYQLPVAIPTTIMVEDAAGDTSPYSRALHQRGLQSCGISGSDAANISRKIYDDLLQQECTQITSNELRELTHECIRDDLDKAAAQRYQVWEAYTNADSRPLLVLIGGTAGCGKSTISTETAGRLNIVRTQSTDMLREVMRMMIPEKLIPVLHRSSFNAWKALPTSQDEGRDRDELLIEGYHSQAQLLSTACDAVIQRARREQVSMILEGAHLQPSFMDTIRRESDITVVPLMLATLKPKVLRKRIKGRGKQVRDRRSDRYLKHFDAIWQLQSHLLSEADQLDIPIIANDNLEKAMQQIMITINEALAQEVR